MSVATQNIEKRAASIGMASVDSGRTIEGYAALFNSRTEIWPGFYEEIAPGAFKDAIGKSDVRALFNHDQNRILARTSSGTLQIGEDDKGLWYRFEMPDTTEGNDLLTMIKRGDISQSSFAFTVKASEWIEENDNTTLRIIKECEQLFDVSPVTYPAYQDTSVTARKKAEESPQTPVIVLDFSHLDRDIQLLELDNI